MSKYEQVVSKCILQKNDDIFTGVVKVYQEVLISTAQYSAAQEHVSRYLNGEFFSRFSLTNEKVVSLETDMAIALANAKKMFPIVLPWIIQYFSQTKTASIDLNRYKLEAFLMTDEHPDVNDVVCNAIFDRNCYIREHMADIIGEKRICKGVQNLCQQLRNEENYYTAVSIIEALGKLGNPTALPFILEWIAVNKDEIILEKQFFVLKHARITIAKLDDPNASNIYAFDNMYGKYLVDYCIL